LEFQYKSLERIELQADLSQLLIHQAFCEIAIVEQTDFFVIDLAE
jgi:hypothetical protein